MIINMPSFRVNDSAKKLKKILRQMGFEVAHTECLELSARLFGFESWQRYCHREFAPLSPFDQELTDEEFAARDAFQMKHLIRTSY